MWINFISRISTTIHRMKEAIVDANVLKTIALALFVILLELLLLLVSLPLYIFIAPDKFSSNKKEIEKYRLKRKVSLAGLLSFVLFWIVIVGGIIITNSASKASAMLVGWSFDDPVDYIYDSSEIQIVDGMAVLKETDLAEPEVEDKVSEPEPTPEVPTVPEVSEPTPIPELTPAPEPSPTPTPEPTPEPTLPVTYRLSDWLQIAGVQAAPKTCTADIQPVSSLVVSDLIRWTGFIETASKNGGEIYYQLSDDGGATWYYWQTDKWKEANSKNQRNIAAVVNNNIEQFPTTSGQIMFKAYLVGACTDSIQLIDVTITYDQVEQESASIRITSPNGGESLTAGSTSTIKWLSTKASDTVAIEYSKDNFIEDVNVIADSAANLGTYDWVVPSDASTTVKLRIFDLADKTIQDISDANFTIVTPAMGPVSQWPFDHTVGCAATDIGDNNPGTLSPECSTNSPVWSAGIVNNALSFDGIDDYVAVDSAANLNPGGSLTLSAWVRWNINPTTGNKWASIINRGGDNRYRLQHNATNTAFQFGLTTSAGGKWMDSNTAPVQGVWYLVVATYDGQTMKLYVNGALENSRQLTGDIADIVGPLHIGSFVNSGRFFNGKIDEVGLWNRALSASEVGELYLVANDTAPTVVISPDAKQADDGYVYLYYTVSDAENDFVDLSPFEYSATGSFSGEEAPLTGVTDNPKHDGVSTLSSSPTGIEHTFVWNVAADLPDLVNRTVYIRLRPTDGIASGEFVEGKALVIDTQKPAITNLSAKQAVGSNHLVIGYSLSDTSDALNVELDISEDSGATWTVTDTSVTGNIGTGLTSGIGQEIIWDAGTDFSDRDESDLRVRLRATDAYHNVSQQAESSDLAVDTKSPVGLGKLQGVSANDSSIVWSWAPVSAESHFNHYEIWYSDNQAELQSAPKPVNIWDGSNDSGLANIGTTSSIITGLGPVTLYYAKIWAIDDFGNRSTTDEAQLATISVTSGGGGGGGTGGSVSDTVAPFKPILDQPQTPVTKAEVRYSGTAEPNSSIELYVDGQRIGLRVKANSTSGVFTGTITLGEGEHKLSVTAADATGNISEKSDTRTVVIDFTAALGTPIVPEEPTPPETTSTPGTPIQEIPIIPETLAATENQIFAEVADAKESSVLPTPQIAKITSVSLGNDITIAGTGIPNSRVVTFIRSERAVAYQTTVNEDGNWSINHSQTDIELTDGDHEVYALTLDTDSQIKSQSSEVKTFSVKKNRLAVLFSYFDLTTTLLTVLLALIGIAVLLVRQSSGPRKVITSGKGKGKIR